MKQTKKETASQDIVERCSNYLSSGGLFNPEFADHDAVRDLVINCRDEIERLREVVMLLVAYDEQDEEIQKGAVMWDVLIEAAHAALKEKE